MEELLNHPGDGDLWGSNPSRVRDRLTTFVTTKKEEEERKKAGLARYFNN